MNDEELLELFSAFDDVSASDALQSSTLDLVMGAAVAAPEATQATEASEAEVAPSRTSEVAAVRGARPRLRSRWRAIRTAAVAACLAFALTGGAAYAYPASTVLVTQGDTTIELQVNMFGQVLSASANNDDIQSLIDELGLVNTQYSDSVSRVSDSLKENNPQVPVEVMMNGRSVEVPDEASQSRDEDPSGVETPMSATGERTNLKTESATAESEPEVPEAPSAAAPAAYVPEPSGITESDDTGKSEGSKCASESESDWAETGAPSSDESVDEGADADGSQAIVIDEPTQPVVVDENPGETQGEQPVVEPPSDPKPDVEGDEEVVYDPTRPPKHHGEARAEESASGESAS